MLFNSLIFLIFLPTAFFLYWKVFNSSIRVQNIFLLCISYLFYGWWDYRFLFLIAISSMVDYLIGRSLEKEINETKRKVLLAISLIFNLGILGVFKYLNFFIESWIDAGETLGFQMHTETLSIILPVGISFYTFQTLSYTLDIYYNRITPTRNFINFAAFVSFFPQLVAGPIERAANLLPQFKNKRIFNSKKAINGLQLIIWGLFQKMVIADSSATYVNAIFENYQDRNTLTLMLGAIYFAFQIYGDFAGYSNIAIGTARLFGFNLMRNFNYPYFSKNIAEFWRRWHISLSTWFRDYLYIPLGGSRGKISIQIRNIFIIFLVSGLWHGANWTFIAWGALHACLFIPLIFLKSDKKSSERSKSQIFSISPFIKVFLTFSLVTLGWVFFRSASIRDSLAYLLKLFTNLKFKIEYLSIERYSVEMLLLICVFVVIEFMHRNKEHPLHGKFSYLKTLSVLLMIFIFGVYSEHSDFIYFQF